MYMLVLNTQLDGTPVMSLQTGAPLGSVTNAIIDPRKLQVVAFYVIGPRVQETSVLHTSDIRELGPLGFIVDGADSIMALDEDLVRLQEVISLHFTLLGKPVFDENQKRLGKVFEYTVETDGYTIQKIHVSQSLMANLTSSNLIIHRSQIVELTDKSVIVRSASVRSGLGLAQAINPFRKSQSSLIPDGADQLD
jgi:uncharacterized protein YrrD